MATHRIRLRWWLAGCDPTRPTAASLRKGGFALSDIRRIGPGRIRRGAACISGLARPIAGHLERQQESVFSPPSRDVVVISGGERAWIELLL